ncbi:hypothetical protein L6452_22624 [Arctium lappa]|uniref:Uncharacterized protein n=1 Tax=Arctium lappa TaxID=4217 RepID=A0ACB9B219_ARCLA|nr:hypothetical protein L6452_22624 [Arctium lappa]
MDTAVDVEAEEQRKLEEIAKKAVAIEDVSSYSDFADQPTLQHKDDVGKGGLLYVESTSTLNVDTLNSGQATKKWTLDILRARQDAELALGGFGYTSLIVDERDATEATNSQRAAPNAEEAKEKRRQGTYQQNPPDEPMVTPLVVSKSVHVCDVATPSEGTNKSATTVHHQQLLPTSDDAISDTPGSLDIQKDKGKAVISRTSCNEGQGEGTNSDKQLKTFADFVAPSFNLGISPPRPLNEMVQRHIEKEKGNKRLIRLGEKCVHRTCNGRYHSRFRWRKHTLDRKQIVTLASQIDVSREVIDAWVGVMNDAEKFRSSDSPRRDCS